MKWLIMIALIWMASLASKNPKFLDSAQPDQANVEGFYPGAEDE